MVMKELFCQVVLRYVNSALRKNDVNIPTSNYIGGLGGKNISCREVEDIYIELKDDRFGIHFLGIGEE